MFSNFVKREPSVEQYELELADIAWSTVSESTLLGLSNLT